MSDPSSHAARLIDALRLRGPSTSRELSSALEISQPSVSRALAATGDRVAHIGRARRTRYAAIRDVRGLGTTWPVFRIDIHGRPHEFGLLTALYGAGTLVSPTESTDWLRDDFLDGLFPGVPWFLDDQRPQGFLGRQFAQRWSREPGLPSDILRWSDDAVLTALLLHGEDAPGDFVLGKGGLERALQSELDIIPVAGRDNRYGELAIAALTGESVGSSAAGEQPKFTATVDHGNGDICHVIVKFSEPVNNHPAARRWADLLICEHLASQVLAENGNASARTELIWSQGRLCLEVTRFDRVGAHGRRGCVTLAAWSDAHDGERDEWPNATERMRQGSWISASAAEQVRLRWWFGRMIANTDMHFGNLCFFLDESLPLELTPSYDMLPMLYRPASSGELVAREFRVPTPTPADSFYWNAAAAWAEVYWQRVAEHDEISADFRQIAEFNSEAISRMRRRFDPEGVS
ncbi:serine/threonine protein kinase HipA of HipAB toxin-antitoxin module [Luteibacter sp. OK325]|uniref:type II toxin-antitoxin system HipA family toxin YjjJ n=1 Tax=Luteibacter sp. OK325 TaxID=2135670 RepID=UPI000D3D5561|nr:type II toxin-antitoxin system HipA family toxin YjjJ [Luteibacter sp. OK325]PTR33605.1 serine/threonine protein kinase HipA of HipAB toxin-antitoxin module [Luteibacter sp. OK325]